MHLPTSPLSIIALVCAGASALILVGYLAIRPKLGHATHVWLALGLGVFPIGAAAAGNIEGFEATKERKFCGSCHVMSLHADDSDDPASATLAARHAKNRYFGAQNCYACHADYGMFGTVVTKAGGMRHVWLYYTEYKATPIDEAKRTIVLRKPYPNDNCMQCHSTRDPIWSQVSEHRAMAEELRAEQVSCASAGCHGLAHPYFTQPAPAKTADAGAPR
jgi:cytochrome c-type protein NapC